MQTLKLQTKPNELNFFLRVSGHTDLSYEEFREGLLFNHTTNEQQYVPDLKHSEKLKVFQAGLAEG